MITLRVEGTNNEIRHFLRKITVQDEYYYSFTSEVMNYSDYIKHNYMMECKGSSQRRHSDRTEKKKVTFVKLFTDPKEYKIYCKNQRLIDNEKDEYRIRSSSGVSYIKDRNS